MERVSKGWHSITDLDMTPVVLPAGEVLLTSSPLAEDGQFLADTTAWIAWDGLLRRIW